jgi:hypothetical protein
MTTIKTSLPQAVRARDIAEAVLVPELEVTKWCREGRFPRAFKTGGRTSQWRIPLEDAVAFLTGQPQPAQRNAEPVDEKDLATT